VPAPPAPRLHRPPEAVFLDAGNTLLQIDYGVIAEISGRSHPQVTPDAFKSAEWAARVRLDAMLARSAARKAFGERQTSTESRDTFQQFMAMIFEEAGIELSADSFAQVFAELEDYHQAHNLWRRPHPFAIRVLEHLKDLGVKLAVVSNSGGDLEPLLERLGMLAYLDTVIDSGVVAVEKPDPRIFHLAAERLRVPVERAAHVGDLYAVDVVGARSAGAEPVLIDPGSLWPQTDCVKIRDLTALPDLVRRAQAAP
jgi:putative hydrolase of the HAD superfamily